MGAEANVGGLARPGLGGRLNPSGLSPSLIALAVRTRIVAAITLEAEARRPFLWLPVIAGAGALTEFSADREPSLAAALLAFAVACTFAFGLRQRPAAFALALSIAAGCGGFTSASLRTHAVAAPVLDRIRIAKVTGWVEEVDLRRQGARFLLRVAGIDGLAAGQTPKRVRLTMRRSPGFVAGDYIEAKARLLPPSPAALPGGYDFARDAYFAGLGAVGNVLGKASTATAPSAEPLMLRLRAPIDHARNALARRITAVLPGAAGAIAVAMVTGKRDLLDEATLGTIRQAGIFHIITISGVQMTLVAGILFWLTRALLAMSRTLALERPIKLWAAGVAIPGALAYDIFTGSRVGTERALVMTMILLSAVVAGRRAFSMRNLALAAFYVVAFEPEAIGGASFQLSFAAVAALIAVFEARATGALAARSGAAADLMPDRRDPLLRLLDRLRRGPGRTIFATLCATAATAPFMAADFHELSPYVLIGNPMTLLAIELFAVPGALIGTLLYPLGLDAPVWHYVGAGIDLVLWGARHIAAAPAATLHLPAFAPWAAPFLALAVLSVVLWRTPMMRATALPFLALGIWGAMSGPHYEGMVAPSGDSIALRAPDGRLAIIGRRPSLFAAEQWLRADADGRPARAAVIAGRAGAGTNSGRCDRLGCAMTGMGTTVAVVLDPRAFAEDCRRADIIVSPLYAPSACGALTVIDRARLAQTGAVAFRFVDGQIALATARAPDEDRPWSRAPKRLFRRTWHNAPTRDDDRNVTDDEEDNLPLQ